MSTFETVEERYLAAVAYQDNAARLQFPNGKTNF